MESTKDLKDWTNPDLSLPDEPARPTEARTCLGCGSQAPAGEVPPCGH